ncbi:helix-turn-helix domain-containing protein [Hymenobacter canadensis]|uniref:Helix-turn-helix transcriptional regulator n=1 Tax=Hymenobacter canadensis TaxID=2999067 RepID=A0ABY7LUE6_9BACT|nr:helix-turn-helix transcriptional regulator [Hymenobacter canadensis]WBA42850.1 helix-turn-helix transcriptional regulator [Hymenobacter canadensis]
MFSAARIVAIRKSRGFSQEVLAEQSGVSLRTIQRVEQGDTVPRGHTLLALAAALQVPLEELQAAPAPADAPATVPADALIALLPETTAPPQPLPIKLPVASPANLATIPAALPANQGPTTATVVPAAAPAPTPVLRADPEFLQLLNLSALSFLVLPLLNLVVPFVLWRKQRHTIAHAAEVGRRVLGFQVLWQVGCFFAYVLLAVGQVVAVQFHRTPIKGGFLLVMVATYLLNVMTVGYYARRLRQGRLDIYPVRL